ncbi:MAG: M48 family metallopeptidase, partial [Burkholderiales bacterium]|nr:M48 family metallopeptidase [Burkholderiales bacterium]
TFSIEARFGFNKTTRGLWVLDSFKALAVGLVIGVPLLMLLLWLVNEAGRYWWLWAWASMMLFQWVMLVIYPTIIAPIFNKFTPMPESETKSAILALLSRCGFTSNGLFVMDGSKRTSHGNAYFTGLGNAKRIVFFDTLLNRLKQDELLAVLAHELGHFKNNHIKKRMIFSAIGSLIVFALLAALMNAPWFYEGLGFSPDETDSAMTRPATALVLFMLALPVFSFFLTPIASWYSRRHEFEADHYGASQTSKDALIRALVCLYEDNAATVTPDALYSMFYDSHPSAPLRIAHLSSLNPATP